MRLASIIAITLCVAGCASSGAWTRPGGTPESLRADGEDCLRMAYLQYVAQPRPGRQSYGDRPELDAGFERYLTSERDACLRERGYRPP